MNTRLGELGLDVGRLHRLVLSNFRIGETGTMPQKVLHDDRLGRRHIRISGLAISAGGCHAHLHVFERRRELGDGIGELDDVWAGRGRHDALAVVVMADEPHAGI